MRCGLADRGGDASYPDCGTQGQAERQGSTAAAFILLNLARVQPVPVAGCIVAEAEPLPVGNDESPVPENVGDPVCDEAAWLVPSAGGAGRRIPVYGFLSPSGARYAYWQREPGGERRLWVREGESDETTFLYHGDDHGVVESSPDERHMVVNGFPVPNHRGNQLTVAETEMGEIVYECLKAYCACWSPDGSEVAYWLALVQDGKRLPRQLVVWNQKTGEVTALGTYDARAYGLRYSPDGRGPLFGVDRWTLEAGHNGEVWIASRADGSARKVFEDASARPAPPAWTTAGDACWFRCGERLVLLDVQSDPPRVLLNLDTAQTAPAGGPRLAALLVGPVAVDLRPLHLLPEPRLPVALRHLQAGPGALKLGLQGRDPLPQGG